MIDIFNKNYTDVATAVRTSYPGTFVTGERINAPSQFPSVMFVEADSYEDERYRDNRLRENVTALMYEITVYSNKRGGKRAECISILSTIDDVMRRKNARRIARVEGYYDSQSKIYMVTARYRMKTDGTYYYAF